MIPVIPATLETVEIVLNELETAAVEPLIALLMVACSMYTFSITFLTLVKPRTTVAPVFASLKKLSQPYGSPDPPPFVCCYQPKCFTQ